MERAVPGLLLALFALFGASGCGDSKQSKGDGAGNDATPSAPEKPGAGLSFTLSPPSPTLSNLGARACTLGSGGHYTFLFGTTMPGMTATDGVRDQSVVCTVSSTFIDAHVSDGEIPFAFSLSVPADHPRGTEAIADITFDTDYTSSLAIPDGFPKCTLGPTHVATLGLIDTDFSCPLLGVVGDDTSGCQATGRLTFEHCATK